MKLLRVHNEEEIAFWRKLTRPEDEKDDSDPDWQGTGYRWFRDPKILCFEHYRRAPSPPATKAA
jgi:hypothetical protein